MRIHQSFLINMRYIGKLSSYVMVLTTGKEISVPKSRYPEVKRQYTLFKGLSDHGIMDAFFLYHGDRDVGQHIFL
ncbi:LytTR family transcriptional regulator DNA-binding domain-containing protein [Lachnospiraceae bacterium 54-11]